MKSKHSDNRPEGKVAEQQKKSYQMPQLTLHGTLEKLTKRQSGKGGLLGDGGAHDRL